MQSLKWVHHIKGPATQQRLVDKANGISNDEATPIISAKYLKHKHNWWVQTTSTKTRVKGKANDQNRSQYFIWSTFNQTRRSPKKDQIQIIEQSHQLIKIRQRQTMWSHLDIKNRKYTLKQKSIQWPWYFLYKLIMLWTYIMQKIRSRRAEMIGEQKCTNATSKMWHKLSHYIIMCQKQW